MAGSEAQAGFYYQNIVAAQYVLDLIEFGSQLRSVTLENPRRAKYIDDIIADSTEGTTFVQVKWSQDDSSAITLHNLITSEDDSGSSLWAKLARGYRQATTAGYPREIILLSTRKAGTTQQPAKGFDKSLKEFIKEFLEPFIQNHAVTSVSDVERFVEYQPILERLLDESGLQDLGELSSFLKCLRFRLSQPDRETAILRVQARLVTLGIGTAQYGTLLDEVVKWSITGREVRAEDVLEALGLQDRFIDRTNHNFPVDRKVWVETPQLFEELDASIATLDNGFILLEGEAGSGKSTALTMYLSARPDVRFGYYCFVPNDRTLGNQRLSGDAFVSSLCIGLRNAFPEVDFPKLYEVHTLALLNEWLNTLSAANRRVVFVVDGLDVVDRKTRQSLIAQPLTSVLDGGSPPPNVLIVLSSRYPEALPQRIIDHVKDDPRRHIRMLGFGQTQVREFFRLRATGVSDELMESILEVTRGVPIYLEYMADRLGTMSRYEQEEYLKSVPTLRDDRIDAYHQHLWEICKKDESLVYILSILAIRNEFTAPETLREFLHLVGMKITRQTVHDSISEIRHVLRLSDAKSVAIRHSSLAEFIAERTSHLHDEITRAMVDWYDQHSDTDEAWRHRFRHLFEAGEHAKVLVACNDEWLEHAWVCHRPIPEIQQNLDIAWYAASLQCDFIEFIRIGLLKQRIALVSRRLDLSETQFAQLLLDIGHPDEALRRVWDGERRQCSTVDFASFCLSHVASTSRLPQEDIFEAGLGDSPDLGSSPEDHRIWYRARILAGDPVETLGAIETLRWRIKDSHGHGQASLDQEESRRLNLNLQLAAIHELAEYRKLDYLERVRGSDVRKELLAAARAATGVALARMGEIADARAELRGLDLICLSESERRWYFLELAACGIEDVLAPSPVTQPRLPNSLLESRENKLSERLFNLYDELREFFLQDETSFPWFEAAITGLQEPIRTFVFAIGHLAKLWTDHVRKTCRRDLSLAVLKRIVDDLDLSRQAFRSLDHEGDYEELLYRQNAHRAYEQVWSCATLVLAEVEFVELARWWALNAEGARARRYPEATRALAIMVFKRLKGTAVDVLRDLLEIAESSERADEEASVIAAGLVACASAWGRCGFPDETQRLWRELLDVACGVYFRKDYQFNEILTALKLAHEQDPHGTLARIEEQLTLAHQLVGTSRSKTVQIAIEGLLEFLSRVRPDLALDAITREEKLIYRERALSAVILTLIDEGSVDLRLLLALAVTIRKWDRHDFEEQKAAMFALYTSALQKQNFETARKAYILWRQISLVEKQIPSESVQWASAWISLGGAPTDVQLDYAENLSTEENLPSEPVPQPNFGDADLNEELEELAGGDLANLEAWLDKKTGEEVRQARALELDRIRDDLRNLFRQRVGRQWCDDEDRKFDEYFGAFAKVAQTAAPEPNISARRSIRENLNNFLTDLSRALTCRVTVGQFEESFDLDEWLNRIAFSATVPYSLAHRIEARLPEWIGKASIRKLSAWEEICHRRFTGETRAAGLLALAERRVTIEPGVAIENLVQAWESASHFFYERGRLKHRICSKLLELDKHRGIKLLLDGFIDHYRRFPESIIYALDHLIEFSDRFTGFDAVRLYEIWSAHNRHLAAGLSHKPVDLRWITSAGHRDFQDAVLRYLIGLFDYPVVDVRLLAADELLRLFIERPILIDAVLNAWPGLSDGQKEYVSISLFSLGMKNPVSAESWASPLLALGQREPHRNLRATIAETIQLAVERGANLAASLVLEAQALLSPPRILLT